MFFFAFWFELHLIKLYMAKRTWRDLLLTNEQDFDPVYENSRQSPDTQELEDYEEYSRRELPRLYKSALEFAINQQTQPLEEQLRSQLVAMIQDCQDKVFSAYKAFKRARSSESSTEVMQGREDSIAKIQTKVRQTTPDIVSAAFESAPLQNHDQANPFLTYSTDANPQHNGQTPRERSFSDSAYGTQVCDCSDFLTFGLCNCSLSSSSNQLQDWPSITRGPPSQWPSNEQCFSVNLISYDPLVLKPEISRNECSQGNEQPLQFGPRMY